MINNNNGLIARKADGEILMFNEDGDRDYDTIKSIITQDYKNYQILYLSEK